MSRKSVIENFIFVKSDALWIAVQKAQCAIAAAVLASAIDACW